MSDPVAPSQEEKKKPPQTTAFRTYASDVALLTGVPLARNVKNEPAPPPPAPVVPEPPKDLPPAYIIPKAPTTNESHDDVLTRLRKMPAVPRPSSPPVPIDLKPTELALPGLPPLNKPTTPVFVPTESPLHTYKSDFSKRTQTEGVSRIGMVAAEQDAGGVPAPMVLPARKKSGVLLVIAGIILVVAGSASVYGAYLFATGEPAIPTEAFVPSLIFADERIKIEGSGSELREKLSTLTGENLEEGDIAIVYMVYGTTTEAGIVEEVATGGALFDALRLPAPDILLRNVEPESTLGIIETAGETHPFFILKVSSYDRTFAGMLEWEPTIERDLFLFYPPHATPSPEASTTPSVPEETSSSFRLSFVDEVIENRDVRVLRNRDNRIIMLYGYRDKETLIIVRSVEAFKEMVKRLASTGSR